MACNSVLASKLNAAGTQAGTVMCLCVRVCVCILFWPNMAIACCGFGADHVARPSDTDTLPSSDDDVDFD